jgi:LacI family transcriptional regulator
MYKSEPKGPGSIGVEAVAGGEAGAGKAARLPDVARLAKVSTATADRVLNRRPGVREATAQRVLKAALELGYIAEGEVQPPDPKPMRITVLLPAGSNRYLNLLGRLAADGIAHPSPHAGRCRVEYIQSFSPELLARALMANARGSDGIAFMALEHPAVREAVNALAERGVPTITLISDVQNSARVAYLGLDNRAAGRTAAYLIARFIGPRAAKVAMIAGSRSYRAHEEREMGFLHLFEEMFPAITVVGLREGHDEEAQNFRQMRALLAQHPDLAGIYNIGGGAGGIGKALSEARRGEEVVFISHGLTPDTRALLMDGTMDAVITQNPQRTLASCLAIFANLRAGLDPLQGVELPRSEIIFRENLP